MDSMSFMDLLTRQDKNPYESVDQVPMQHNTQGYDAPSEGDRSRTKWTLIKYGVLISAWLNISKDPIVSNEKKGGTFWKRIVHYVATSPKLAGMKRRESDHCKQMWGKINDGVCKFVGSYEAATKQKSSGQNENDVVKLAEEIYFNDYKVKFSLEHAWRKLRHDKKLCASSSTKEDGKSKRRKCNDEPSTYVQGSLGDESVAWPLGIKTVQAKTKKVVSKPQTVEEGGSVVLEFESMWEIKQKDVTLREKLSTHKLLESGKIEPSELEVALKKKLINDMLPNI